MANGEIFWTVLLWRGDVVFERAGALGGALSLRELQAGVFCADGEFFRRTRSSCGMDWRDDRLVFVSRCRTRVLRCLWDADVLSLDALA